MKVFMFNLNDDWREILDDCLKSKEFDELLKKVDNEYVKHKCCPPRDRIFNAFNECGWNDVKVVILGQDPYFNEGQAVGMSFSINPMARGVKFPPSLRNIIKEVRSDIGSCAVEDGDLSPWARQGVLLLNTCLTVRRGAPLSHAELGWEYFTQSVLQQLNKKDNIVFVLWGSHAQRYREFLTNNKNLILTSSHPSPLSATRGFLGCRHFSKINNFLKKCEKDLIVW